MGTKKHYLVTGGAGFIGSNVIKALLQQDNSHVTCIDNFDAFYPRRLKMLNIEPFVTHPNFNLLELNLDDVTVPQLHEAISQPVDAIIHLAARAGVRPSLANPVQYEHTNIIGTQKLLDYAQQNKIPQFVFASSSSVYGENINLPWQEGEQLLPISPYAMTKLSGEMAGHVYSRLNGLRFVALRFFTVYGPGQRPDLAIHKFTKAMVQQKSIPMFGDGSTSRDYTFVDDIVQGVLAAVTYNASLFEIINLGNNHTVSLKGLIEKLEAITGKKAIVEMLPEQPGDLRQTSASISKAERLLNYKPQTTLDAGLKVFYDWYMQHQTILNID